MNMLPARCYSLAGDLVGSYRLQTAAARQLLAAHYCEVEQSGKLVGFIPRRSQVQILPSLFASEEALFHESICREMGAFLLSEFDV